MGNFCGKCGKELNDNAKFCGNCGNRLSNEHEQPIQNTTNPYQQEITKPELNIMTLIGFILGCVSFIINFWGIVGIVVLVFSIVGFTQTKNNDRTGKGFAIAGMILGSISIIYLIVVLIVICSLV